MTPEKRRLYEKAREEANRRLDPHTPATKRWITIGGIALSMVLFVNMAVPLPGVVVWPACLGLAVVWLVNEFGVRQAWRLYDEAHAEQAHRVALMHKRDALTRELLGRGFLWIAYSGTFRVLDPNIPWFIGALAWAGFLYLLWLAFLIGRVEWQMRAAGKTD